MSANHVKGVDQEVEGVQDLVVIQEDIDATRNSYFG